MHKKHLEDSLTALSHQLISPDFSASGLYSHVCTGEIQGDRVAIWANNPHINAGTFGRELGDELDDFLDLAGELNSQIVILCIDSAGVALDQPQAGMRAIARGIQRLHHLNALGCCRTVALIGAQRGCYGGALLLAGACQYRFADPDSTMGVSGYRILLRLSAEMETPINRNWFQAAHRMSTGEIDGCIHPDTLLLSNIRQLPIQQLTLDSLQARLKILTRRLNTESGSFSYSPWVINDTWNGFEKPQAVSLEDICSIVRWLLENKEHIDHKPLFGNVVQEFSFSNEKLGFSLYLSLLAATTCYLNESGKHLTISVDRHGNGAIFIAFSMLATSMKVSPEACIEALPATAVETVTKGIHSQWRL